MLVIKTIHRLPSGCYDDCICCHDGWCRAICTGDGNGFDYQAAQDIRPYNCPLEITDESDESCSAVQIPEPVAYREKLKLFN